MKKPKLSFTYEQAMELFPFVAVREENLVLLNLIAEAIMKEKLK